MSSSSGAKKVGSQSGLRILWIPGRKKNNRKGQYNPTNKNYSPYSSYAQRPNEAWSLGGAKSHANITKTDFSDMSETVTSSSSPLCISGGVALTKQCLATNDTVPVAIGEHDAALEGECNLEVIKETEPKLEHNEDDDNHSNYNNAATLALRDRKKANGKDNLDSIERLDNDLSYDDIDTIPRKFKKKKKEKKDDGMVTCLYYSLMCCECSIS